MRGERETEETGGGHGCRERERDDDAGENGARGFDLKIGDTCDMWCMGSEVNCGNRQFL